MCRFRLYMRAALTLAIVLSLTPSLIAAPPGDSELQSQVDAIAAEALKKPGGVGLSIGVSRGSNVVVAKGYGLADAEFDVPADKDTMFRIGSVTKQFTAAAIMTLLEQGKISLEDDTSKFLPDYPMQGHHVTIRHLLTHTSGIVSYTDVGEEWQKLMPLELSHEELLALVKDKPFEFEPGTKWAYNNTAYYMLGMIIENISGKSYAEFMQDEFFTPMNLDRTRYDVSRDLIKNRAQGYSLRKGELANDAPLGMSQPGAAGALLSTGEDLVRWSKALSSGNVVSADSFKQMITPVTLPDGTNTEYGFGLMIGEMDGVEVVQHGGGIHGFNSMLIWVPEQDLHVAVISNGEALDSGKVASAIMLAALGIEKAPVKDEPIDAELLARIAGTYVFNEMPMDVKVWAEDGKAMVQAQADGQSAFRILYQGADASPDGQEFRADFDPDARLLFAGDGTSFTLWQHGMKLTATRKE